MHCKLPSGCDQIEGRQWVGYGRPRRAAVGHEETAAKARWLTEVRSNADIYTAVIGSPATGQGFQYGGSRQKSTCSRSHRSMQAAQSRCSMPDAQGCYSCIECMTSNSAVPLRMAVPDYRATPEGCRYL